MEPFSLMVFMTTAAAARTEASGESKAGVRAAMDSEVLSVCLLFTGESVTGELLGRYDLAADDEAGVVSVAGVAGV